MNFNTNVFKRDIDIMQEVVLHISKYNNNEIIITDDKFNIIFQNSKYITDKTQYTLFDIADCFLNENIRINIENFKNSEKNHLYLKLIMNDNNDIQNIPVDLHITKIRNKKNKIKGYSVIIQDITQEVKNKIQKETFIDIISHDLKNPMRANIQILELIMNNKFGKVENRLKTVLEELLNSCKFMTYMADNLLIKYKNEIDLYELQKEEYSIVDLIKERCNKLMKILDKKNQTIELAVKGDIQPVKMDKDEITKVINNLIINASEQSAKNAKIYINIENDTENISVSFIDYGYNQHNENLSGIFEEYLTCSNKFRKVGFSLELYNCRKIIEAHDGHIYASNVENGTSITFCLPL